MCHPFTILPFFLFFSADALGLGRKGPPTKRNEDLDTEKAMNRTLAKLQAGGEQGRFVLLVCKTKCLKERADVPSWIREFNALQNRSKSLNSLKMETTVSLVEADLDDPPLGFHFHFYKKEKPFPMEQIEMALRGHQKAVAFYVVAGRTFAMDVGRKEKFMKWLEKFEHPKIVLLADGEVDDWLNSECHGQEVPTKRSEEQLVLLVVHDTELCPETLLKNFARSFMENPALVVLELRRPLTEDDDFLLHWRLQGVGNDCRMDILLHGQHSLELPSAVVGSELHQIVGNLSAAVNSSLNCSSPGPSHLEMRKILPPPNPIELEFLREEKLLKAIEHNKQYLTVGAIGGVAVVALAMSIFWGLRGNDFVTKQ